MLRHCNKCDKDKPLEEFSKSKTAKWCRLCNAENLKRWRDKNPDYWKKRYDDYPKFFADRKRMHVRNHRNFLKELLTSIRLRKQRNGKRHNCSLTIEYLLLLWDTQSGKCAVSGLPMLHERHSLRSVSIDRVNSSGHYTPDNVQLVCRFLNLAKQHYSNADISQILEDYHQLRLLATTK